MVVSLNTGAEVTFPPKLAEGLAVAKIEITPSGLDLHWPKLDADPYVPDLLAGAFGDKRWMAAQFGAPGGSARSKAKTRAARANGRLGGRPRKTSSKTWRRFRRSASGRQGTGEVRRNPASRTRNLMAR